MKKTIIFLMVFSAIFSCGTHSSSVFFDESNENTKMVDLTKSLRHTLSQTTDIIDSAYVVALQSPDFENKKGLVGNIKRIIITDDNIIIYDTYKHGSVVIFDTNGNFVKRIETGRGHGEINGVSNIVFDYKKNQLYVNHQITEINAYTADGDYINSYKLPLLSDFIPINEGYLMFQREWQNEQNKRLFFITDTLFVINQDPYIYNTDFYSPTVNGGVSYFNSYKGNVCFFIPHSNKIYNYVNGHMELKYLLLYDGISEVKDEDTYKSLLKKNEFDFMGDYKETSKHISMNFCGNRHSIDVYCDKTNLQSKSADMVTCKRNITTFGHLVSTHNDFFVRYIPLMKDFRDEIIANSSQILSPEDLEKVKNFSDDDNPLLVFYRLKSFVNE